MSAREYIVKQVLKSGDVWSSPVFLGTDREIAQNVTAGFIFGEPRWAETPEGEYLRGVDGRGLLMHTFPVAPDRRGRLHEDRGPPGGAPMSASVPKWSRRRWAAESRGSDLADLHEHQPSLRGPERRLPIFDDAGVLVVVRLPTDPEAKLAATLVERTWRVEKSWKNPNVLIYSEEV